MNFKKVKLEGSLVFSAPDSKQKIRDAIKGKNVALDFSGVESMDSSGVDVICELRTALRRKGGSLRLYGANPQIRELLEICGFTVNHS